MIFLGRRGHRRCADVVGRLPHDADLRCGQSKRPWPSTWSSWWCHHGLVFIAAAFNENNSNYLTASPDFTSDGFGSNNSYLMSSDTILLKWACPGLFFFSWFSHTNFTEKTVGVSGIRTRIVGVESEHADHLTTTTDLFKPLIAFSILHQSFEWMSGWC